MTKGGGVKERLVGEREEEKEARVVEKICGLPGKDKDEIMWGKKQKKKMK